MPATSSPTTTSSTSLTRRLTVAGIELSPADSDLTTISNNRLYPTAAPDAYHDRLAIQRHSRFSRHRGRRDHSRQRDWVRRSRWQRHNSHRRLDESDQRHSCPKHEHHSCDQHTGKHHLGLQPDDQSREEPGTRRRSSESALVRSPVCSISAMSLAIPSEAWTAHPESSSITPPQPPTVGALSAY